MPIEDRDLKTGTVLTARYKKQDRTCEVVETPDGVRYRLDDGSEHRSPSSAGKVAMGGVACNGWRFWSVAGTETPKREPKQKTEKPAKSTKPAKKATAKKKGGAKKPKAKAVKARSTGDSYGCGACGAEFETMKAATAHAMTHTG